jgi:four helix bundle protein
MTHNRPDLSDRLLTFSARVIRLLDTFPATKTAREVEGQLLRSGMGVGANYEEARGADSRADFCNKLQISFKEMRETHYWLCLTDRAGLLKDRVELAALIDEATQLRAILGKSVATARGKARERSDRALTVAPAE